MDRRLFRPQASSDDDGRKTKTVVRRYKVTAPGTSTYHGSSHHSSRSHRDTAHPYTEISTSSGGSSRYDVRGNSNTALVYKKDWRREQQESGGYVSDKEDKIVVRRRDRSVVPRHDAYDAAPSSDGNRALVKNNYYQQHRHDQDSRGFHVEDEEYTDRGRGHYRRHTIVTRRRTSSASPAAGYHSDNGHQKRHMAEGALVGASITALLQSRRDEYGELPEHRGRKVLAGAALGAIGAEALRRAQSAHDDRRRPSDESNSTLRKALGVGVAALAIAGTAQMIKTHREENEYDSRGRGRSKSKSRRRSRSHSRSQRYHLSRGHSRSRSRSSHRESHKHSKGHNAAKITAGTLATTALARQIRHQSRSHSRSRSRSRSVSRRRRIRNHSHGRYSSGSDGDGEDERRREKHRIAKVAAGTAATAAVARQLRDRSRSRSRSHSRIRTGAEIAGAGLVGASAAKLLNMIRGRSSSRHRSHSHSRSRSRSLSGSPSRRSSHPRSRSRHHHSHHEIYDDDDDDGVSYYSEYDSSYHHQPRHRVRTRSRSRSRHVPSNVEPTYSETSMSPTEPEGFRRRAIAGVPTMSGAIAPNADEEFVPDPPIGRPRVLIDPEADPMPLPGIVSLGYDREQNPASLPVTRHNGKMATTALGDNRSRSRDRSTTQGTNLHRQGSQDSHFEATSKGHGHHHATSQMQNHRLQDMTIATIGTGAVSVKSKRINGERERSRDRGNEMEGQHDKAEQRQRDLEARLRYERRQTAGLDGVSKMAEEDRRSRPRERSPKRRFEHSDSDRSRSRSVKWNGEHNEFQPPFQSAKASIPKAATISSCGSTPIRSLSPSMSWISSVTPDASTINLSQAPAEMSGLSSASRQPTKVFKPYREPPYSAPQAQLDYLTSDNGASRFRHSGSKMSLNTSGGESFGGRSSCVPPYPATEGTNGLPAPPIITATMPVPRHYM